MNCPNVSDGSESEDRDAVASRPTRNVYYVSDGTAITAQTVGRSLLTQFESSYDFHDAIVPFIDNEEKARGVTECLIRDANNHGSPPIVFSTFVSESLDRIVRSAPGIHIPVFHEFLPRLEQELGMQAKHTRGLAHGATNFAHYMRRIDAMNFALLHDDGLSTEGYAKCELILIGVSRVGKTPTSLYLALQHGIFVANYPLSSEDLAHQTLPSLLRPYRNKLFGLTISSERLQKIRQTRRPDTDYSSRRRVQGEVTAAEGLMRLNGIPFLDTTQRSVEEIASTILQNMFPPNAK
jgi:regulator of PEP synthase PpsR (kinase-PPPase family)